jgi:NadR type nicotinamide-nucleotide adenylyltransferase
VVLIGPECTGKTWLAERLARDYGVASSVEYARVFVDEHPRRVEYADVDHIGRGQQRLEDVAIEKAASGADTLVIHDTDLVSTVVYSRHYYGDCPSWIPPAAASRLADLYLLHDTDVPWIGDAHQRVEPERRAELLERFRATLAGLGAKVVMISGDWETRFHAAGAAIDRLRAASARE